MVPPKGRLLKEVSNPLYVVRGIMFVLLIVLTLLYDVVMEYFHALTTTAPPPPQDRRLFDKKMIKIAHIPTPAPTPVPTPVPTPASKYNCNYKTGQCYMTTNGSWDAGTCIDKCSQTPGPMPTPTPAHLK